MTGKGIMLSLAAVFLLLAIIEKPPPRASAAGQEKELVNPLATNRDAIEQGGSLFRIYCGFCHGAGARGGARGPDLSRGQWIHGGSDAALFRTIRQGVAGTEMPPNPLSDEETWMIIAYLRSLSNDAEPATGNREAGEKIYFGKGSCNRCHMINGQGGRLGPDLSRVGASRSSPFLIESIREPDNHFTNGLTLVNTQFPSYETVIVTTPDGRRITGIAKNEDTFSIQLMDGQEQFHFFAKKDLKEVIHQQKSLMPAYSESVLSASELQDLLAYLTSLRGQPKP